MSNEESEPLLTEASSKYQGNVENPTADASISENEADTAQQVTGEVPAGRNAHNGKKLMQYVAALSCTLGAMATGTVLGWSSPMAPKLLNGDYGFPVSQFDVNWISSLVTLGAAAVCAVIGYPLDRFGRKRTMLAVVVPFVVGWALITSAKNIATLFIGRFIVGMAGGAFCIAAPTYTAEIAQDSIRGALGSYYQLMITVGVLFSYVIGSYVRISIFNLLCTAIPVIFAFIFYFMPESPRHLVSHDKIHKAHRALKRLRGFDYDVDGELNNLQNRIDEARANPISLRQSFETRAAKKALVITWFLMIFQQLSGVNAIIFNSTLIFHDVGSTLSPEVSTIIIGSIQVGATFASSLMIDRLGRKVLLLVSASVMGLCTAALGAFFYLKESGGHDQILQSFHALPVISLALYIVVFSIGFGPIPWMIASELARPEIQGIVSSTGSIINWLLAFAVTSSFGPLSIQIGNGPTFWMFAGFNILGFIFTLVAVPETKGKSLDEIQMMLNGG